MSHGVADKNYFNIVDDNGELYANRLKAILSLGWLSQKAGRGSERALEEGQIYSVGWPRLDPSRGNAHQSHPRPASSGRTRVLWAPTHDYRKRGDEQLRLDLPGLRAVRSAARAGIRRKGLASPKKSPEQDAHRSIALLEADVVISDFAPRWMRLSTRQAGDLSDGGFWVTGSSSILARLGRGAHLRIASWLSPSRASTS